MLIQFQPSHLRNTGARRGAHGEAVPAPGTMGTRVPWPPGSPAFRDSWQVRGQRRRSEEMHSPRPKQLPPEFGTSGTNEESLPLLPQRGLPAVGRPPRAAPSRGGRALPAAGKHGAAGGTAPRRLLGSAPGRGSAFGGDEFSPPN